LGSVATVVRIFSCAAAVGVSFPAFEEAQAVVLRVGDSSKQNPFCKMLPGGLDTVDPDMVE
jgi:hypothetical protein